MHDTITLIGLVATSPRHIVTADGLPITSFRLASSNRRFDRAESRWIDGETNWYSVTAFRQLALNSAASLQKGDRVILSGKLKIRNWENGGRSGLNVDVDADSIGPDLSWGTARYTRSGGSRGSSNDELGGDGLEGDQLRGGEPADPDQSFADVADPAPEPAFLPDGAAVVTPF
jgi:single-strand DNA-binding protein